MGGITDYKPNPFLCDSKLLSAARNWHTASAPVASNPISQLLLAKPPIVVLLILEVSGVYEAPPE